MKRLLPACVLALSLLAAPAAAADPWVRVGRALDLKGHGYGHGHGMSQYGAYGAALRGLSYRRILAFYYPGTELATARRKLRVLVSADTTPDVRVRPRSGLRLHDRGTGRTYRLPAAASIRQWRITPHGTRDRVHFRTRSWHRWRPGGAGALVGEGEFRAAGPITLVTPGGAVRYRGALRAARPGPGSTTRDTVNVVRLDDYVRGVVPAEMPASWHPQAVRAQAVAARTYAVWSRAQNRSGHYQICDTTLCQVYAGVAGEHPLADAAVVATRRRILRYQAEAAFTQFSASSGGWTAAGAAPYLRARRDPYDRFPGNPVHTWTVTVRRTAVERAFPEIGRLLRVRVTRRDGAGQWGGRVLTMKLDGSRANRRISGDDARWALGLRSTYVKVR